MLVLSRRPTETIRFPQLGISVSIVSIKGSRVRLGIEAPPEIQVLRRELEASFETSSSLAGESETLNVHCLTTASASNQQRHDLRNRLNKATLGLHLAQKQLEAGQVESANKTLSSALQRLAELEEVQTSTGYVSVPAPKSLGLKAFRSRHKSVTAFPAGELPVDQLPKEDGSTEDGQSVGKCIDVLLVEDDPNEQALLRGLLEMEGYQVHTASNGHEALGCLSRVTPSFVLLDMLMPECDGRETLQRIRQIPAFEKLPVYAVSGSSPESVGLSIGSDGVDDWFPKPLNASRLVQHMRARVSSL